MFSDPLLAIAAVPILAVLVILLVGIAGFVKGGDFSRRHTNRIMRYRVAAQAVAVAFILFIILVRGGIGQW